MTRSPRRGQPEGGMSEQNRRRSMQESDFLAPSSLLLHQKLGVLRPNLSPRTTVVGK